MATDDNLTAQLRAWGFAQANRFALTYADRSTHVLEKARDMAPGTRERALRDLVGRDGGSRRRFMAERSGVQGLAMLPTWAVDPIRSSNDADKPHDNPEIAVDVGIPDELRWVERALASMMRQYPLRALIVHTEFTVSASQAVKARMVAEKYGGVLTVRQYRYELGRGLDSLRGAIAA
ncbi:MULTISPECIES: hypothetical protein [unclassified Stenotrophomonas]|uniref:hypothetical protein n=1 Tax=unclassified Stenotrophomonas TaxID=196198 RepID=UPI003466B80C